MTEQEQKLLNEFRDRLEQLLSRVDGLKEEKLQLLDQIRELEGTVRELEEEKESLERKYDHLKLAKTLSASDGETKDAKDRINKLVREIDKCIALLNK